MSRIVFAAAMIAALLAIAKKEHVLDRAGLLGSCSELADPAPEDSHWRACRPGSLTGYPDLSSDSCTRGGMRGEVRYWICPTTLVARANGQADVTNRR